MTKPPSKNVLRQIKTEMSEPAEILDFKDGDDGGNAGLESFNITVATNGFILNISDDDGDIVEVHYDIDDVFKSIRSHL